MAGATRSIEIAAPIEKFFATISDYESYPKFLSDMATAKVKSRNGNVVEVTFSIKVVMDLTYTLRLVESAPKRIDWSLVTGQMMKSNDGSWALESLGPDRTRATYSIELGLKGLVPKSVSTGLIETTLPKTLEAFKKRAESKVS